MEGKKLIYKLGGHGTRCPEGIRKPGRQAVPLVGRCAKAGSGVACAVHSPHH